jgi:uncharacterized protein DUF6544
MSVTGADVTRSAAGRLACEFVMAPATALDPRVLWKAVDESHAVARFAVGAEDFEVTLRVGPCGALETAMVSRWGNPDKSVYQQHIFGVECDRESAFEGFTIPSSIRGGWWLGTERWVDGEFIRLAIDRAIFR